MAIDDVKVQKRKYRRSPISFYDIPEDNWPFKKRRGDSDIAKNKNSKNTKKESL